MEKIKVVDISYVQQKVDFEKIKKQGIKAVIIRTGYLGKTDTMFKSHIEGAIRAGLDIGVYTYIISQTPEEAVREAKETIERLSLYRDYINYPVFCDMEHSKYYNRENYTEKSRTDIIEAFCEAIKEGGYYPGVYINPSWLEEWTEKSRIIGKYDIWLAAWTDNPDKNTVYNYGQTMWQWGAEEIDGVKGMVDSNFCYVDYPDIIKKQDNPVLKEGQRIVAVKDVKNDEYDKTVRQISKMGFSVYSECK